MGGKRIGGAMKAKPQKSPQKWTGVMWAVPYKGAIICDGYGWLARMWPGWWTKAEAMRATNQGTEGDESTARRVRVTITPLARKTKARAAKKED